jgi:hypothetical protein
MHNLTHVSTLEREKTWGQKPWFMGWK